MCNSTFRGGVAGEIFQRPDDDGGGENHRTHLFQVLRTLVPHVYQHVTQSRHTVRRQLHHELLRHAAEHCLAQHLGGKHSHDDAEQVETHHHQTLVVGEERAYKYQIYRQSRGTRHKRDGEHRNQTVLAVFEGAGGHNRRHGTAEAHNIRYERASVQAELVEKLVHHKGGTSHIARIFHYGDEQKEYQDVRQERDDRSHTSDDAIDDEVVEDTCGQQVAHHAAEPAHKHVEPFLRIGADGEGALEHQPHKHQ